MIVRNESVHLDACLASAAGLADELVVVDTGSSDDTPDIARRYGARMFEFPWCDDFAAARNESIRHARGDWILWLDADDRIPARGHAELRKLLKSLPSENVAYLMTVLCPGPDGGPMSQAAHARLFRNRPDVRWRNRVHEQIVSAIERGGGRLQPTDIAIVHVGYSDRATMSKKLERNLRLVDLDLGESPLDLALLQARAITLLGLGRTAEALVALNLCEQGTALAECARNIYALRGEAYAAEGRLHEGLEAVQTGLSRCPRDSKLSLLEGQLLAALGDLAAAEQCLRGQRLVGEEHGRFACADRTIAAFRTRHVLAEVLLQRQRPELAELEARAVVETRPSFGEAWLTLGEALVDQGKIQELEGLRAGLGSSADADIGRTCLEAKRRARAGELALGLSLLKESLCVHPQHLMLLKAKARLLFGGGDRSDELKAIVRVVLESEPLCVRTSAIQRELTLSTFGDLRRVGWSERAQVALGPLVSFE
jgi:tetratricopeptide (TPR) repeat protein